MTKYRVRFLDPAKAELGEIKGYLNREAPPDVRKAFAEQLSRQLETAKDFPDINAIYPGNTEYHRMVISNHPYCAYYKIDHKNKTIDIYRVLHTSRDNERLMSQEKTRDQA